MDTRPVGVFDSGLGGLTAVRQLTACMPEERIVYFGDTGRVPYGSRSRGTIRRYARQDAAFLLSQDVKMIVAACGTVSSVAADLGQELPVPFLGVLGPTAQAAAAATRTGRIGVIGTTAHHPLRLLPPGARRHRPRLPGVRPRLPALRAARGERLLCPG